MFRTGRNNAIRIKDLEEAMASDPETYRHIDIVTAGWPCQDNSIAGKRTGHSGDKSGLWSDVRRIVGIIRPNWFIGENVPGLFSVRNGKDFWGVISDLDSLGYCVAWRVLDAQSFGLGQRRKRVFIVGSLGNIGAGKVLFQQEGGGGDYQAFKEVGPRGLCISTRDGLRQDPQTENIIAYTIGTDLRGQPFKLHTENIFAEAHPDRKAKINGDSGKLDSSRGVVIGNAVCPPVTAWIGRRIVEYEKKNV